MSGEDITELPNQEAPLIPAEITANVEKRLGQPPEQLAEATVKLTTLQQLSDVVKRGAGLGVRNFINFGEIGAGIGVDNFVKKINVPGLEKGSLQEKAAKFGLNKAVDYVLSNVPVPDRNPTVEKINSTIGTAGDIASLLKPEAKLITGLVQMQIINLSTYPEQLKLAKEAIEIVASDPNVVGAVTATKENVGKAVEATKENVGKAVTAIKDRINKMRSPKSDTAAQLFTDSTEK